MLYIDKLYEGISVELSVPEGEYQGRYKTKIEGIGTKTISVGTPIIDGQFVPLREGTAIEVTFADEFAAYSFSSSVLKRISNPIPTLLIDFPYQVRKIQRRKFVRVQLIQELSYRVLGKEDAGKEKKGFIINLSGGGLTMKVHEDLPLNTLIRMRTTIGKVILEIPGITVRSVKEEDQNSFTVAVAFYKISERMRDQIIKYVFDVQRQMRKKGLV